MKISYAILACVEVVELEKLLPFLHEHKNEEDEIVILLADRDWETYFHNLFNFLLIQLDIL